MNISFRLFGRQITIDISRWNDEDAMRREWHKNGIWLRGYFEDWGVVLK